MGLRRFLIINLKIGLVVGIIGFLIYLVFNPIEKKNYKNFNYSIYYENLGCLEDAKYVKDQSKIPMLKMKSIANFGSYGNDIFFLSKNNVAWIIDTIGKDAIKFKAIKLARDSSIVTVRGYTLIEYVHPAEQRLQSKLLGDSL